MTTYDLSGSNYSETDSSNSNAAPAGMPEGMAPSGVNDAWRSHAGAVKRAYDWDHAGTWATVGGTGNAITLAYTVAPNALVQGQKHSFKATAANSGATTVNVSSLGVKNVFKKTAAGPVACTGGEIQSGDLVEIEYDGTQFQIMGGSANAGYAETFATIASATSTAIGAATANYLQVTGTTTITSFDTVTAGVKRVLEFAGILTLTHSGTALILPGGASITTAAGDVAIMISEGSGNWRCASYMKAAYPAGGGKIAQVVNTETGAVATGTTQTPFDDTIPQNTEGDQYMSLAITPTNASSTLLIEVRAVFAIGTVRTAIMALFQDSTANALAAVPIEVGVSGDAQTFAMSHKMTAGTTSATTIKFRAGGAGAGTMTFNGQSGSRLLGGASASSITITEILP
jgi:hypothetical protein